MIRSLIWIIVAGMALLWTLSASAQAPAPCEIRIYQENPTDTASTWGGPGVGPTTGYTGLATVSKRFRCPVLQCCYSSNVAGVCPNPLDLPAATHPAGLSLVDMGNSRAQRFAYLYADFDAGGVIVNPVTMGLIRPFHPGADHNPQSASPAGSRLRIEVVQQSTGLVAMPQTGGYRLRITPPGVRKPVAMSWAGVDNDLPFAVKVANPAPARTPVNLIDADGDKEDLGGDWWAGYENAIMANPATCPTARWTIKFGDANGTPEPTPLSGIPQWFTLYRGVPADNCSDGWATTAAAVQPGNVWVSSSEEIAFSFDPQNLQDWLVQQIQTTYPGWTPPAPPPWPPNPPPWETGEISITIETYSNCVYLPYPSLVVPPYPNGPDNFFTTVATIQDVNAADQSGATGFTYEPRIGETGLGRIDVQERVNLSPPNDADGNPISAWRPFDVDRDAASGVPNAVNSFVLDADDTVDSDLDGRTDDYVDRSLHAYFFCSREEAQGLTSDPLVDRFMPLLDLAAVGSAWPGSTIAMPAGTFLLANRTAEQTLRCSNCGAVHPITGAAEHPIAPPGPVAMPAAVSHSTTSTDALAAYCEFCGTPLDDRQDMESQSAEAGIAELTPLRTITATFSRVSFSEASGSAKIPFENVLFGPFTLPGPPPVSVRSMPVGQAGDAAFGVRIPSYQPPSIDAAGTQNYYAGVGLVYETRDEHNRWYYEPGASPTGNPSPDSTHLARQSRTGAGAVSPLATVTTEHLLFDGNGVWDTHYFCPDCGSKESLPAVQYDANSDADFDDPGERAGCLNAACLGHSFCPVHGSHFAATAATTGCVFWRGAAPVPTYLSATPGPDRTWGTADDNQAAPNLRLDEDTLTAEEYEPVRIRLSVPRVPLARVAALGALQLGDVAPGSAGTAPHGTLNADTAPQATSQSVALPVRNVGNVVLDALSGKQVALNLMVQDMTRADGPQDGTVTPVREQQTVPVNTGAQSAINPAATGSTVQPVDYLGATVPPAAFNMMPAYPEELLGSALAYWPGPPVLAGPAGLRGGALANASLGLAARPVPNGTPVGEYAGEVRAIIGGAAALGSTPLRLRVVESRLPASSIIASDASPSLRIAPAGAATPRALQAAWSSNGDPTGGPATPGPASAQNVWSVTAPLSAPPADDPFYDHRWWDPATLAVAAPQPAETLANAFHVDPFLLSDLFDPTRSWLYWHARRLNPATGDWDSAAGVSGTSVAPYLFDTREKQRGLRAIALQEQPALHWLFWHSDEEGQPRVGFSPRFDPTGLTTAIATSDSHYLRLTNARLGSAEPLAIEYRNYTGGDAFSGINPVTGADPLAEIQLGFDPDVNGVVDPLVRKPASDPFIFTKDPWVLEYAADPLNPAVNRLHVLYSAGLRHQRNADICWSMFDAFADWDGDGTADVLSTNSRANYGKIAFARRDAVNGKRLLPFSANPALRNDPRMRLGEKLTSDGGWQSFASRHLDWVTSRYYPMPPFMDSASSGYWADLVARTITTWSGMPNVDPAIYVVLTVDPTAPPYRDASAHSAQQWDPTVPGPVTIDPTAAIPVLPVALTWDARDRDANGYDERTGLIRIVPVNLPPDPALSAPGAPVPVRLTIDPSSGVVTFSRPLFNERDPGDVRTVFNTGNVPGLVSVEVWLDYQPFTNRITTDGDADEAPSAAFDNYQRLAVFWHRRGSVPGEAAGDATKLMYKLYSSGVQALQPPFAAAPAVEVLDPTGAWVTVPGTAWTAHAGGADGIIIFDPVRLAAAAPGVTLPAEVRMTYNGPPAVVERHRIVGWSKEMRVPAAAMASEQPAALAAEVYRADTDGDGAANDPPDIVKYWLFWSSTRGLFAPGTAAPGSLLTASASDVYYGVLSPAFGSLAPE